MTGLAQKLREKAPLMTETYVAYGATRDLVKECIKPGEYKIPQVLEKGGEIPTDANGVHIGVGEGWWYGSKFFIPPIAILQGGKHADCYASAFCSARSHA